MKEKTKCDECNGEIDYPNIWTTEGIKTKYEDVKIICSKCNKILDIKETYKR